MCIYCEVWGDGIYPWYLNPRNYSRHMYTVKPKTRVKAMSAPKGEANIGATDKIRATLVDAMEKGREEYEAASAEYDEHMNDNYGLVGSFMGQAIPLRDMEKIVDLCAPMGLIGCICRSRFLALEEEEHNMTCMGMGVGMLKWERYPERYKNGVYFRSREETKEWLREMDKNGFMHMIMLFGERFIAGICNCDYPFCDSLQLRIDLGKNLLKGHYVAEVNEDICNGCGVCAQRCQFGALKMSVTIDKANVDPYRCFGCGLCETGCPRGAISLVERTTIPALKEVW